MKPNLVFTAERQIASPGRDPIRLAVTMQAWTDREIAEGVSDREIQKALTKAADQIAVDVFGEETPAPAKEICDTCRFWCGLRGVDYGLARCARRSPVATPLGDSGLWPLTVADDFCGDYQRVIQEPKE